MAGIYIHIPFCKKRCNYCDFFKTTNLNLRNDYLFALKKEILNRYRLFSNNEINSIYFGGGTPSVLKIDELLFIFNWLHQYFTISKSAEITIEVNPDDFSYEYASLLKNNTPVNRISFGIQSKYDSLLELMGRRHNAHEGINAIERAYELGFNNITADLIYGIPGLTIEMWENTLNEILKLPIKHVSSYHLTFEKDTAFYCDLKKGILIETEEQQSIDQFRLLVEKTSHYGFKHYEISNFALPGYESFHNSNYWTGESYLGLGPSAHSYFNNTRQWNVSDLNKYIKLLNENKSCFDFEELSKTDHYNEILMLGLRTSKGVSIDRIQKLGEKYVKMFLKSVDVFMRRGEIIKEGDYYKISPSQKFVTDGIIQQLFET